MSDNMDSFSIFGGRARYVMIMFLFFFLLPHKTYPKSQPCVSSSCGKISNITYPFRLKHDPDHCGNHKYELDCVNNVTVLKLFDGEYFVESINYNNYTIRIVDHNIQPKNCSPLPRFFLYRRNFTYYKTYPYTEYFDYKNNSYQYTLNVSDTMPSYYIIDLSMPVIYMKCTSPPSKVVDRYYADTASCVDQYTYVIVGDPPFGILEPQCRVKLVTLTSLWGGNLSYIDIHKGLSYGFEISWMQVSCHCDECYLNNTIGELQCGIPYCPFDSCGYWATKFRLLYDYVGGIYDGLRELTGMDKVGLLHLLDDRTEGVYKSSIDIYKAGIVTGRYVLPYLAAKVILGIILFSVLLIYTYRRRHASIYENIEDFLQGNTLMPIRYSYKEIKQMTKGFKVKLGEGGYGDVYRGNLISGPFVAIKMLKIKSNATGQEFISEVATIGRIYHSNVVRLIGFCVEGSKRALVYEYMPNGSLDKYIFNKEGAISLTYNQIYEISLGVARGISYLHQGCDMQILHFDIKPHNILLDENFVPKVSDFGLAKLYPIDNSIVTLTAARGTIGYMAPELFYYNIGGISYKADVYSFGMLLIEMASRRRNLNPQAEHSSELYFPFWIYDQLYKNREREMEDVIMEEINDVLKKMFLVALWCIQLKPIDRPSMNKVVEMLEGDIGNIEMPPKPLLYPHETIQENFNINSDETVSDTGSTSYVEEIPTNPLLKYSA
ncbi:LEAF RUST 10 DISEASE-RESISTANCE LOCUS RECEPTOR-LIKE PROTEIN KINASE-like 2.4 isoform X2 [Trifolium pratense]|uniref:LEAF RUST 10 DISEASE-RESISTANCE LOCUS RECEPTOR-LIKE PROTEIN KINASE-like 2.4 isoform X2 n=1 Tax=Trifolium pratense TaxID=57577 RepID=UPI001E691605|nr:LEAF RUST 10 DISEASE-RESISTANCE LOCUS RECEPTOR-LIKE PROTEIN KINASE-like 2.4 isoform X2 [Trifolium pratense]